MGNSPQIPNLLTESKYLDSFKSYYVFTDLRGYPPWGVGGWVGGGGVGWRHPLACAHMQACASTCTHTCMHVKHDKHGCLHGGGHLQFPNMFILAFCACACMHVHVHMSRDTLPCPQIPPHPPAPPPWSRRSRNLKNAIKCERIEIIEFRLKICDP